MGILDLIFPKICLSCDKSGAYICSGCIAEVGTSTPVCPYCEKESIGGATHLECRQEDCLDGLVSVWNYEGIIRKAILALKYKYSFEVGKELANVFIKSLDNIPHISKTSMLIPVPMHWRRQSFRGFNQSEEIGKLVAKELRWEFNSEFLTKKKPTISQTELSVSERKQNMTNVFTVNPIYLGKAYPSVVVFDDVFTTGSTLKEAAKVLKNVGVEKVWGLTIAR